MKFTTILSWSNQRMIKMEEKVTTTILDSHLNEIFARLRQIDREISRVDIKIHHLHEEIETTGNFNKVQLKWKELKWDKWMLIQEKEAKLLLVDDELELTTTIKKQH